MLVVHLFLMVSRYFLKCISGKLSSYCKLPADLISEGNKQKNINKRGIRILWIPILLLLSYKRTHLRILSCSYLISFLFTNLLSFDFSFSSCFVFTFNSHNLFSTFSAALDAMKALIVMTVFLLYLLICH